MPTSSKIWVVLMGGIFLLALVQLAIFLTYQEGTVGMKSTQEIAALANRITQLEKAPTPHDWIPSTLGHGDVMCRRCRVTNREAAVIGTLNECSADRAE